MRRTTPNATPNTATKLVFTNKDAGVPHDFALYKDSGYTQSLFSGDQITGPANTNPVQPPAVAHDLFPLDPHAAH